MRINRLLAFSLALVVAFPVSAAAASRQGVHYRATTHAGAAAQAERALARAKALFRAGPTDRVAALPHRDATMVLRDLAVRLDDLPAADRRTATAILARPTDSNDPTGGIEKQYQHTPREDCSTQVCVHWIDSRDVPAGTTDPDAVPATDADGNGLPDQVDLTIATFKRVWQKEVVDYGYRKPLPDSTSPTDGTDPKLDVYLEDLGDQGIFGYCTSDDPDRATALTVSAYCVLDDDFARSQFHAAPKDSLEVTAAHEFFHAVQFAYDWREDIWLMEGTATWMEDEVFDSVNDNFRYLNQSPLRSPGVPVDYSATNYLPYGSWVFWKFLSDHAKPGRTTSDPTIIKQIWKDAASRKVYSTAAVKAVLARRHTGFTKAFTEFGVWNRLPALFYSEGKSYPAAPVAKVFKLTGAHRGTAVWQAKLQHMTNAYVRYTPGPGLAGHWRLQVRLNMPDVARGSGATLMTHLKSGRVLVRAIKLDRHGGATARVDFSRSTVRYVELSLTDAGTHFTCNQGTSMTCGGLPRDDDLTTAFQAKAVR